MIILHLEDVVCPVQLRLEQHGLDASKLCLFKDFSVSNEIIPVSIGGFVS